MPKRPDYLRDERVLWLLFALNAVMGIYWATAGGGHPLLILVFGFISGIAFMNAMFQPHFQSIEDNLEHMEHHLARLIRDLNNIERMTGGKK